MNDELVLVPKSVMEALQCFDDDLLADVLRLWDCNQQEWVSCLPTVFRFERDDLLVWHEKGTLRCRTGAIDTHDAHDLPLPMDADTLDADLCLTWRSDRTFADLIGCSHIGAQLLEAHLQR